MRARAYSVIAAWLVCSASIALLCPAATNLGTYGPGVSPSRQYQAYIAEGPESPDLFVRDLTSFKRRAITHNDLAEASPAWSPDSSKIAFNVVQKNGHIDVCVASVETGAVERVTDGGGRYMRPFWLPTGEVACTDETDSGVRVRYIATASGAATDIGKSLPGAASSWSPDVVARPGFVSVTRETILPSGVLVTRYFTASERRLVTMVDYYTFRYCRAVEAYYYDTDSADTITWREDRATGVKGTAWTIIWDGLLFLPESLSVTFTLEYDQRIYLWIDDTEVYSTRDTDGTAKSPIVGVELSPGIHFIHFAYFDDFEGGGHLNVLWEASTMPRDLLGPMVLK